MALERYFGIRHGYFYMLHFSPQRARFVPSAIAQSNYYCIGYEILFKLFTEWLY